MLPTQQVLVADLWSCTSTLHQLHYRDIYRLCLTQTLNANIAWDGIKQNKCSIVADHRSCMLRMLVTLLGTRHRHMGEKLLLSRRDP
jgi:hypothetical protein